MKLIILGNPVSAGRPRFSTRGGFAKAYDPKKSRDYKVHIKQCCVKQLGRPRLKTSLKVEIGVYRPIQKHLSKREYAKRLVNDVRPTVKPDADNYIKIILDGLNGLMWVDDNQIVDIEAHKYYSDEPRVEVFVNEA